MTPAALRRWDKRYVWHPFTQQAEWARRKPILIKSGRGVWLEDSEGHRLLDGNSSLWVNVWGHRRAELDRALKRQIDKISHSTFLGLSHEPAVRLAKKLIDIAPKGLSRVFYSDNGSTAVEIAIKMAYQYWKLNRFNSKTKFVSLKGGYHGDTIGSVSVGGIELFHARFRDLLFKGWQVDPGNFDQIAKLLLRSHKEIAAVVMEPLVQGASGIKLINRGYLSQVARLCRRYDILLIIDEVATGFGRTGTMFACEQEGVSPDFLCVAKSLTGGYLPLAATLTMEKIYRTFLGRFNEFKAFFHGHTYTANPLACAVGLANLELYEKTDLLKSIRRRILQMATGLASLRSHPHVKEVRQAGLMAGVELIQDKAKGLPYPPGVRMGLKVCDEAIKRGVWLRPLGDVIVLMPPLAISEKELAFLIDVVRNSVILATG